MPAAPGSRMPARATVLVMCVAVAFCALGWRGMGGTDDAPTDRGAPRTTDVLVPDEKPDHDAGAPGDGASGSTQAALSHEDVRLDVTAAGTVVPATSIDPLELEVPQEDPAADGPVYNASGEGFHSSVTWAGKCWYRVTNFCVIDGALTLYHPPSEGGPRHGSLRMCNEFSQRSALIRLGYRSEPAPAVLPGPLLTKTQGWVLQFWCQDLFHMTLTLLPAFNTKRFLGDHPDVYVRIAKGKRKKSAYCRIKFGHPRSYDVVRNPKWGGDTQFPFAGNPYWPFYQAISPEPWRLHALYKGASKKRACYKRGVIDKLYVKDMNGHHATNYTAALRDVMRVPPSKPRTCGKYRVTMIDRRGRTRRLSNVPAIVDLINADPAFTAQAVALETLPIREQLALMTNTDVLMGMHGNGITWLQFLPAGGVVVELIGVWYQPYAKLWGLKHLHSSMGNNMDFKRQGEYVPFAHNLTEIRALLDAARAHLDASTCDAAAAARVGPSRVTLDHLYSECAPHC